MNQSVRDEEDPTNTAKTRPTAINITTQTLPATQRRRPNNEAMRKIHAHGVYDVILAQYHRHNNHNWRNRVKQMGRSWSTPPHDWLRPTSIQYEPSSQSPRRRQPNEPESKRPAYWLSTSKRPSWPDTADTTTKIRLSSVNEIITSSPTPQQHDLFKLNLCNAEQDQNDKTNRNPSNINNWNQNRKNLNFRVST